MASALMGLPQDQPSSAAPQTRVLAIASHVTFGYVGNKMATFVMQAMGCDVSAINTVNFSNHTAYKQWKGRKTPAAEILELYEGLKESGLNVFDMMLSGYIASKEAVEAVGTIARDLKLRANMKPGSFFWVLDPVMGDNGQLYVAEEIVPAYKSLLRYADLILPNSFEAEVLSERKITDLNSLIEAIKILHQKYQVPNIVITSVDLLNKTKTRGSKETLSVVGSTCLHDYSPRIFTVTVPALPVFFSGTGDMFAALILARLREMVGLHSPTLINTKSWQPEDDVEANALPLARATELTLASMHAILSQTVEDRHDELGEEIIADGGGEKDEKKMQLRRTRASEVRVVRYAHHLKNPGDVQPNSMAMDFKAKALEKNTNE